MSLALCLRRFIESRREKVESDRVVVQLDHGWKGKKASRDPTKVRTILIHQTAVEFGVAPYQVRAAGGDREAAYHKRFEATPYHVIALRGGGMIWNNSFDRYTYHGNGANARSIGFAIEGKFPGTSMDAVESWRSALGWSVAVARSFGCPIEYVMAHRQFANKTNDPGPLLWRAVVEPVMGCLGLECPYDYSTGRGKPIPEDWR